MSDTPSRLTIPASVVIVLIAMTASSVVAYFTNLVQQDRKINEIKSEIIANIADLKTGLVGATTELRIVSTWMQRAEASRFTNREAEALARLLTDRITVHEKAPAHGDVGPRIAALEKQVESIDRQILRLLNKISAESTVNGVVPPWDKEYPNGRMFGGQKP